MNICMNIYCTPLYKSEGKLEKKHNFCDRALIIVHTSVKLEQARSTFVVIINWPKQKETLTMIMELNCFTCHKKHLWLWTRLHLPQSIMGYVCQISFIEICVLVLQKLTKI